MKMFFSANPRGILKNNTPKPEIKPIQNSTDKKDIYNATLYSLKYGMFIRIQNASGCSSCDK